jgi:O-antigen/teichoic acid export membrane protein
MFHLGSGDLLGRVCSIAIVVLLGHRYGVGVLGVYVLAQGVTQYSQPLIDFGLRHVGARLLVLYPHAARVIVGRIQRRRFLMAGAVLPLILIYAASTKLSTDMKVFLFIFSAIGALYAISLDWAAWGKEQLYLVGLAKTVVPVSILIFLAIGEPKGGRVLWWVMGGNAFGYIAQGAIFWTWWRNQPPAPDAQPGALSAISESLRWQRTSVMGMAWLCNLAFNTIDLLMLGVMSKPEQVGLYGAAYRVLNQVLATYYLLTQVLYPRFAQQSVEHRARMLQARILLPILGAGITIAAVIAVSRRIVITILFGHQFLAACPLLLLLALSVPLDFMTSYLSNAFIAWGMEKKILLCTASAAASNVILNLVFIPSHGATAAAINTLVSYGIFLLGLSVIGRAVGQTTFDPQPQAVACR